MKKTYCLFASHYLPYLGGVERYSYNLAKELVKQGHRVIVVTSEHPGTENIEQTAEALVYRLPALNLLGGRFPVTLYNKKTRELLQKLRQENIDYCVINTRFYLISYLGAVFGRKLNVPTILIEHGTGHFTVNSPFWDFLGHIYEHIITWMVKTKVQKFYGVSEECNKWLSHFHIKASGVLYNAVSPAEIEEIPLDSQEMIQEKISYSKDDFVITYTGRLVREKGISKLIDAMEILALEFPKAKLCIAGDGPMYEELSRLSYPNVFLLGRLSFETVINLLRITDVYCLPTDYPEGLPTSVLEALACKVYVITTTSGGAKEVITDRKYGCILDENTPQAIANAIRTVLADYTYRQTASQFGYERLCSRFTWEHTAKDVVEACQSS